MARFDTIKAAIDANINTNGNQKITGAVANSVLKQMMDATDGQLTQLSKKTNISLIATLNAPLPNIDSKTYTLDLGSDPVILVGNTQYALSGIHSDQSIYRNIPITSASGTTATKVIFNINTKTLYYKAWSEDISDDEVVFGGVRRNETGLVVNFPFEYTIDNLKLWANDIAKKRGFALIGSAEAKPNFFDSLYLDLGNDPVVLADGQYYILKDVDSASTYKKISLIDIDGINTSALLLVFNTSSARFYTRYFAAQLSIDEIIVGTIRRSDKITANLPFVYTVDGKELWEITQGDEKNKAKQLRCKTSMSFMAHRGFHLNGIPENSLDAYRYAARCGFDYAETDFQVTSDGELVLMHNESINATMRNAADYSEITGTINVNEHTLADLRENYVLASSDVRMRKSIPTLEEFFITCRNSGIFPVPEIKAFGMTNEQIKKAHDLGCAIMGEGNFGFCSFSAEYLDYARSLSDKTILCYIISGGIVGANNGITGNSRVSPTTWWYPTWDAENYGDYGVTLENVRRHKEAGVKVAVWTTPVSQFDNLLKKEIDCISTDDICPSINGLVGKVATSDKGFSDLETTGYESNGRLILSAGQTCRFNAGTMWLGGYYLSIIGKGNFTISAPNLNVTISNSKTDRYIYQGLVNNHIGELTKVANGNTELEFVEFSCVEL